jgi:hypothetical protein
MKCLQMNNIVRFYSNDHHLHHFNTNSHRNMLFFHKKTTRKTKTATIQSTNLSNKML